MVRGAQAVAGQAAAFAKMALSNQVVLVNGNIGLMCRLPDGRLFSVVGFTIADGKVVEMDILGGSRPAQSARFIRPRALNHWRRHTSRGRSVMVAKDIMAAEHRARADAARPVAI
jgi:hypothetical protein